MIKNIFIVLFLILTVKITLSATTSDKQVHAFFYLWYGNPLTDGSYKHWDHEVLPHWEERINLRYNNIGKRHLPPQSIHSPFYPLRNAYSSKDPKILKDQFADMKIAGINVAVLSWWGQQSKTYSTDTQGVSTDLIMEEILTIADKDPSGIKIALHLEPYPSRSVDSVKEDIEYILSRYGHHTCMYRNKANLPLFYVYDSYHLFPSQWARLLSPDGDISIRGTELDAEFIGLWLNSYHGRDLKEGGFDGIYTYFASDGFSYGSNINNFRDICNYSNKQKMSCILSVGPGYNDTSIRPWNSHNTKDRKNGDYYKRMWESAIKASPSIVSISTFNEWGEGTQIEPARKVEEIEGYAKEYIDYGKDGPYKYIHLTAVYAENFRNYKDEPIQKKNKNKNRLEL